jgi:hypothetical protein
MSINSTGIMNENAAGEQVVRGKWATCNLLHVACQN